MKTVFVFSLLTVFANGELRAENRIGRASVIDGDTIEIHGERIRLLGIDAIEANQICDRNGQKWRCGNEAALALDRKIKTNPITCIGSSRDRYRRLLAHCYQDDEDLGRWMVLEGWAVAFRRYSDEYIKEEQMAKNSRKGLWSSEFKMPWDWRKGERK